MFSCKQIALGVAMLAMGTSLMAATTGQADVRASAAVVNSIVVTPESGTHIADLNSTPAAIKFATLAINSNDAYGFKVTYRGEKGQFVLLDSPTGFGGNYVSSPSPAQAIDYTISMAQTSAGATLGTGLTAPSFSAMNLGTSVIPATTLSWTGVASTATSGYTFDLSVQQAAGTVLAGNYKDTVYVEIASNN